MPPRLLDFLQRTHLVAIVLLLLGALVAYGAVGILRQDRTVGTAGPGSSAAGSPAGGSPAPSSTPASPPARRVTSVFFGDGIVAGANAGDGHASFVDIAARRLGWQHADYGFPGSGYTTAGSFKGGRDYLDRIEQLRGRTPDVLVIEGGANDGAADAATFQAKVQAVLAAAHALVPNATVVLMGPWSPSDTPSPATVATNGLLRALAGAAHLPYIDPLAEKWISGSYPGSGNAAQYISTDGYYPNAKGHAFFGERVAEDLQRLLPATLTAAALTAATLTPAPAPAPATASSGASLP